MIIKCRNDSDIKRYGEERHFRVSPLTPLVRKRIMAFIMRILNETPAEIVRSLKDTKYNLKNPLTIMSSGLKYISDNDLMEKFIALIICPEGTNERAKQVDEIELFLEDNALITDEAKALNVFFKNAQPSEIYEALLKTKSAIMKGNEKEPTQNI